MSPSLKYNFCLKVAILPKSGSQFKNYISPNKTVHLLIHCFIIPWKYSIWLKTETKFPSFSIWQWEQSLVAEAYTESLQKAYTHCKTTAEELNRTRALVTCLCKLGILNRNRLSFLRQVRKIVDAFSHGCLWILALTCRTLYHRTLLTSNSSFLTINYASVPIQPAWVY